MDPYLIDFDEIKSTLGKLKYQVNDNDDINILIRHSSFSVIADSDRLSLHIVLSLPVAPHAFTLFENVVIPKIVDNYTVSLNKIPKYFAVSMDKKHYFENETLNCFRINRQFICNNVIVREVSYYPSCVSEIYSKQDDSLCQYIRYKSSFDVHDVFDSGILLFSSKGVLVNISCFNFEDSRVLKGSFLISTLGQCEIVSQLFQVAAKLWSTSEQMGSYYPTVRCCSPFYQQSVNAIKRNFTEIKLFKMEEIHELESETIDINLHKLKTLTKIDFSHFSEKHSNIIVIITLIIVCLAIIYIVYKFQHLIIFCCNKRKRSNNNNNFNSVRYNNSGTIAIDTFSPGLKF